MNPRLYGALAALIVVLISVIAVGTALSNIPDLRATETAAPTAAGTPAYTAEIEARAAAADPANGANLFNQYGCASCHGVENAAGPYVVGLGQRAGERREFYNAPAYLYESIVNPNAFIVPGYHPGIMPQNFANTIPADQLDVLIAWLLTQ
jgi:mono/diheme cytochrome c family protein